MKKILALTCFVFLFFGSYSKVSAKVLFEDDFNDGVIDTSKWTLSVATGSGATGGPDIGDYVKETDGILRVVQNSTDWGGFIYSKPIQVNPTGIITIKKKMKVHYANEYYTGRQCRWRIQ